MNDVELAQLELRLRKSVVGHAPAAPEALVRFIDTVPAMEPERRRPNLAHARPGVRRAVFALAAAAAIVLAVAGTSALVTIRGSQTPGVPAAGDGWSWQQADGSLVDRVSQVARGFIGVCRGDTGTWSLCTSADGSTWAVPPDQSILTVEGSKGTRFTKTPILCKPFSTTTPISCRPCSTRAPSSPMRSSSAEPAFERRSSERRPMLNLGR